MTTTPVLAPLTSTAAASWTRQLLTRIDAALELGPGTSEECVALAWRSTVRDHPGLGALPGSDDPALAAVRRSLLVAVAVSSGRAGFDTPVARSVAAGAAFLAEIEPAATPTTTATTTQASWLARRLHRLWNGAPHDPSPWTT